MLATPNRNLIFQSSEKVITCWIGVLLFSGHTHRESLDICLEQEKLKGAGKGGWLHYCSICPIRPATMFG